MPDDAGAVPDDAGAVPDDADAVPDDADAMARYRRVSAAVGTLAEWTTGPDGAGLARVLAGDEVVLTRMRAARAALTESGLPDLPDAGPADHPDDLLVAAVEWHRYARGPAPQRYRPCATDLTRGLLRLWARRREPPAQGGALGRRVRQRQARITLLGLAGARCAGLRTELRDSAAVLTRREIKDFPGHVGRRVREVAAEMADEVDWALPGAGAPGPDLQGLPAAVPAAGTDLLAGLFGGVFGLGAALTAGRVAAALVPAWAGVVTVLSVAAGVALAGWVLAARRLLARRAVLTRWSGDVTTALRAALEQYIALRALAAEAAGVGPVGRSGDSPRFAG